MSASTPMPSSWIFVPQTVHTHPAKQADKILPTWKIHVSFFTPFIKWNQNERQRQAVYKIDRSQKEDLNR